MKTNNKLLAFFLTVSMVTSMVIFPVSAASNVMTDADYKASTGVNLFETWGYNWDYDTTATPVTGLYGYSGKDPNLNTVVGSAAMGDTNSGKSGKGKLVTGANASANRQRVNFIPVESGAVYKLTVDVKLNDPNTATDTMVWSPENAGKSITHAKKIAESVNVTNSDWTTISYTYEGVDNTSVANADRMHYNMSLYATTAASYYIDNWTLTKIAAPQVTATTPAAEATDVVPNSNISITFDKTVTLEQGDIAISGGTLGTITTADNKTFTIPVTGQAYSTPYTVTITDVKATDTTVLDNYVFSYTTEAKQTIESTSGYVAPTGVNLFEQWGYNWNYDTTATPITGLYGYSGKDPNLNTVVGSAAMGDTNSGKSGKGKLVTGANASANRQRVNFIPVESGAVYKLTVDVKLNDPNTATDTMVWSPENAGKSITHAKKIAESVNVTNSDWTTISYTYEGVDNTSVANADRMHYNMSLYATTAASYYIDNWTLTKIAAPQVTATTPAAEATDVAPNSNISITFDKAVELKAENITISGGTLGTIPTGSNTSFTIPVTGQTNSTEYTVMLKDVYATDGGKLKNYTFTYETAPLSDPDSSNANLGGNLLAEAGFNWNLELGSDPAVKIPPVYTEGDYVQSDNTVWGNKGTLSHSVVTDVDAPDGTSAKGALLVSGRESGAAARRIVHLALMPDKTYRASVWIKLKDENATATASMDLDCPSSNNEVSLSQYSGETFTVNGKEWTKVYADFTTSLRNAEDPGRGRFHMGYKTDNYNGDLYVDGFSFCEIKDDVLTVQDGIVENETLKIRFTSKVPEANFTAENVEINNGAAVKEITRINDVQYEVSFKNLLPGTNYTVTLKDITNASTGVLDTFQTSFSTQARTPITDAFTRDPSFELGQWGIAGCTHWEYTTEEAVDGTKSIKNSGCGCSAAQVNIEGITVEPSTDYVLTFWAKHEGSVRIRLRNQSDGYAFLTEEFKVAEGDGIWIKYALPFTTPETMSKLRMFIHSSDKVLYLDDFSLYKAPGAMEVRVSTPAENDENVQVDTQNVTLYFTNEIDDSIDFTNVGNYFAIDNGAVITSATKGADNASVTLALGGRFKPSTTYTVTVKNISDYVCQDLAEKKITFKTEPEFKFERPFAVTSGKIDVKVEARAADLGSPVVMYIVYDENGDKVGEAVSSSLSASDLAFEDTFDYTSGAISLGSGEYAVAYMFKSANDLTLAAQPIALGTTVPAGTSECAAPENVELVTDPINGKIKVRGNAAPDSTVSVILIESDISTNAANAAAFKGTANKRDYTVAELTGSTGVVSLIKHIKHGVAEAPALMTLAAEADVTGAFEIELDVDPVAVSTGTLYGVALSGDGITGSSTLTGVYMPATQEFADALNAINTATTDQEMQNAIDTYGAVLQLDITAAVYGTDGGDIAKAILETKSGNYTKETLTARFNDVSSYCERQREALDLLNTSNNDGITQALSTYSDVLGYYENASKLNYQAKYNQFGTNGAYTVNQKIIAMRETSQFTSMNDFVTRFNSITPPATPQGGSPNGTLSGNSSASAAVSPGISGPKPEEQPMFNDIADVQWAAEAIENLANRGIISGMGDGSFAPHLNVTREQFVKMFIQSFRIPTASGDAFSDVDGSGWYAPYVYGALSSGVVTGISDTKFGTGMSITRQDLVTIIYRLMVKLDTMPEKVTDVSFKDKSEIADYAADAVITLAEAGIINGVSDGVFAPGENATRVQTAVILDRLFNTYIDVYFN